MTESERSDDKSHMGVGTGIALGLIFGAGVGMVLFDNLAIGAGALDAYGEVLAGILTSDPSISVRGDVAEECWRIITPILEAWKKGVVPLDEYPAGSAGPVNWHSLVQDQATQGLPLRGA